MKTRENLIDEVIENIKNDIQKGDVTVLAELLGFLPTNRLIQSLAEEEWPKYDNIKTDWIVNVYDGNDEIIDTFEILDRTEFEAEREAMGQLPSDCHDWSMTEKGLL